ncbi:MAG: hypothetical protein M0Q90_15480 [Bacteroidales bacterium]|nr:hypothetical protein [Bacteroidales bacterium]
MKLELHPTQTSTKPEGLLTFFGVLLTVSLQTYSAARRNPMEGLMNE